MNSSTPSISAHRAACATSSADAGNAAELADARHRLTKHLAQALTRAVFVDPDLAVRVATAAVADMSRRNPGLILRVPAEAAELSDPIGLAKRLRDRPSDVPMREWARRCGVSLRTAYRVLERYAVG